jgi:hypothetical protein
MEGGEDGLVDLIGSPASDMSAAMEENLAQADDGTLILGPKFSAKERKQLNLSRFYAISQIEYCRNFIFRRNFPIHKLFDQRSRFTHYYFYIRDEVLGPSPVLPNAPRDSHRSV